MGLVFAMGSLSLMAFALIFGRLSRTYGKNKFIIIGAALGPLLAAYLQEHLSKSNNQGKLLGYLYSAQSIAGSLGAIIGGFVADKYFLGAPYYLQFANIRFIKMVT